MNKKTPTEIMFSDAIRTTQTNEGTEQFIKKLEDRGNWGNQLSKEKINFIQNCDSFYLGTASKNGQPYIQHRGGAKGFIRCSDASTLWFPDFGGNKQYITTGNLTENKQCFIFIMDYSNQRRLKLWGRAMVLSKNVFPLSSAQTPKRGKVERIIQFTIEALDENCRQHIVKRFTEVDYQQKLAQAQEEILKLQTIIKQLRMR